MSFNTFCNICFTKENIIKISLEENESILNVLISFTSCSDTVSGIIYLCINCCNKLEEYDKFRELFLTNFVRFRYLYNEHKRQLEIRNAQDIEKQLKTFVDINVERASGTPIIEIYKDVNTLRNTTGSNENIRKESDGEFLKRDFGELVNKYDSSHADTTFTPEIDISKNEAEICCVKYENDCFSADQENINSRFIYVKGEPSSFDEAHNGLTNTDTVGTYISCSSSTVNETSNLLVQQKVFKTEDEPNPDRFKELHDPLVSDTADDVSEEFSNLEDFVTHDNTDEEGSIDNENKSATSETVCDVCDESFSSKSDLEVHIRTHTGEEHNCDKCNKTFTDTDKLKIHKCLHSGKRPHKCAECGLRFTQISHLHTHKLTHTSGESYKYDECGLKLTRRYNNSNKQVRTGEKRYKCEECSLRFIYRSTFNRHKLKHTGERPHSCDECDKKFIERSTLIKHKRLHSGEKPYRCDDCGLEFSRSSDLSRHKRIHTGEKRYKCDECSLGFSRRYHLNTHKFTHTGEKPYKCENCGLGFTRGSDLNRHKLTHTGEKPNKCDECGMEFAQRSSLNRHKLKHTGERPFSCDECHKSFTQISNLKKHKRTHTGEKPYKCDECDMGFAQLFNLNRHKRTHTDEKSYSGDECHTAFTNSSNDIT